mgnify:CR=1 FL=1
MGRILYRGPLYTNGILYIPLNVDDGADVIGVQWLLGDDVIREGDKPSDADRRLLIVKFHLEGS